MTGLIISHFHNMVEHQGRGMTLNQIRSVGFWIIGESSNVSNHISRCVFGQKLRGMVQEQRMANLRDDRVRPAIPFLYCAVDYFGPWYVKEGHCQLKRYGVLFTCLVSRAVHLEVAYSLTADSFNFAGGPVRQLRSDQRTNFVGVQNELQQALAELDQDKVRQELLKIKGSLSSSSMNSPIPSLLLPLQQNESLCETIGMKIYVTCTFIHMKIKSFSCETFSTSTRSKEANGNSEVEVKSACICMCQAAHQAST